MAERDTAATPPATHAMPPTQPTGAARRPADAAIQPAASAFDRDTAVVLDAQDGAERSFAAEVSADWRAGRGPHGGYLAAMLLRALTETVADPARAPRSLTIHYARAPKPGFVRIRTSLERIGRSLSTLSARMEQEGTLVALALAAFSLPWSAPELRDIEMPQLAPPDPTREAGTLLKYGAPDFTKHVVLQPRIGGVPFQRSELPMEVGGWIGLAEPRPIDALSLAFFSDALYSPPFTRLEGRATSPTIDLTIHFRAALPLAHSSAEDRTGPADHELCLARFNTGLLHEGFFEEDGTIWGADGTILAQSRQLAIIIELGR